MTLGSSKKDYRPELGDEVQPRASVVIPSYNHGEFVGDAISSVLAQTYGDYEILIVDDGSTDNTAEIVAQFGSRVRYIRQENQGLSSARNRGINVARGEFIGLLDADDMYEPTFLMSMIEALDDTDVFDDVEDPWIENAYDIHDDENES